MDTLKALSSLHCELKIMNAKNIEVTDSSGSLFVRCYLSSGKNKRVHLDSQKATANGDFSWNESFFLDCNGTEQSMDMIMNGIIVLELRWRNINSIAFFGGSRLLGSAQVSWRDVFESPNMEIERWVTMKTNKDVKAPSIGIAMKIEIPIGVALVQRKGNNQWDESCGCVHGDLCNNTWVDSDLFVIGAALDAF